MTNKNSSIEMAALKSRHFLLSLDFILPVLLLIFGTILFNHKPYLDIAIQGRYYQSETGWAFNNASLPKLIYHYSNIPALLLSVGALIVLFLSFSKLRLLPYRKISLYLVLVMAIGPGILVNSILKDNWGRPRPRELLEFGGNYRYEAPLTYDADSPGKSFPCGHATMGFYFFALAFAIRHKNRIIASLVTGFSAIWGAVIGWVRVGQGGHFVSDVLWAGCLVYLSAFLLYRALGIHKQPYSTAKITQRKKMKPLQKALFIVCLVGLIVGVLLATPYSSKKEVFLEQVFMDKEVQRLEFKLQQATLKIKLSNEQGFSYNANGFGFPGSKLRSNQSFTEGSFSYVQLTKGFFTELSCDAMLNLNEQNLRQLMLSIKQGSAILMVPDAYTDTLFVSARTTIAANESAIKLVKSQSKPDTGMWIDVPVLQIQCK